MELIHKGKDRSVYYTDYGVVRKVHHTPEGLEQSKREMKLWREMPDQFRPHFNAIFEVNDDYQECDYCESNFPGDTSPLWEADMNMFPYKVIEATEEPIPFMEGSYDLIDYLADEVVDLDELLKLSNFGGGETFRFISYGK